MKINVSGISRNVNSSMEVKGELISPLISFNNEDILVNSPIKVEAIVANAGDHLLITGTIEANLTRTCSRCLESFNYGLTTDFEEELSNKDDSEDAIYFEGDTIDLTNIIINNILLYLPMKSICSEDCKGLCPYCGENINNHKCNCKDESLDLRLTVLKDLLKGD